MSRDALDKYEWLRQNNIFGTIQEINVHSNTLTVLLLNVRSLLKHTTDIVNDCHFMHIPIFTEAEISLEQDPERVKRSFQLFSVLFNNNENKFLSVAYDLQNNLTLEN